MARIIGLDPGLRITGWGIIDYQGSQLKYVHHGIIQSNQKDPIGQRLVQLHEGLKKIIIEFEPDESAVEETFVNTNGQTTLKLGLARGIVLFTPAFLGISVKEYTPNQVKKSVVGTGHAAKDQISFMVQRLLPRCGDVRLDAADALAIAICHAHHAQKNLFVREKQ